MIIPIDMICKGCSYNGCKNHISSKVIKDELTGLEVEVRCNCGCGGSK